MIEKIIGGLHQKVKKGHIEILVKVIKCGKRDQINNKRTTDSEDMVLKNALLSAFSCVAVEHLQ